MTTDDIDGLFRRLRQCGLQTSGNPDAPELVHQGAIDQTWGTREFYVEDPDGNTMRFTQVEEPHGESAGEPALASRRPACHLVKDLMNERAAAEAPR